MMIRGGRCSRPLAVRCISKRWYHFDTFQAGDSVILRGVLKPDKISLSKPLEENGQWQTPFGVFEHNDVIGKQARTTVVNKRGDKFLITHPTLEEYMVNRMRLAQPIYPYDAAAIVNLADIHIDRRSLGEGEILHFLEAGTGHGSLTMAICRAIHGANNAGEAHRGAVLHSVDRNSSHSKVGKKNIMNFRRGMYMNDVQFHVANSPQDWLKDRQEIRLSGVFLDLPNPHIGLEPIAKSMRLDAPMTVFCPSVTQIQALNEQIGKDGGIPLTLITVAELPPGMGGGMRPWDVRSSLSKETGDIVRICRPRAGSKIVGGGFVALYRRVPDGIRKPRLVKNTNLSKNHEVSSSWWKRILNRIGL